MSDSEKEQYVLTLKAKLTTDERDRFNQLIYPASQINALSAIIRWWMRQDEVVRKEILGMLPRDSHADVSAMIMRSLIEGSPDAARSEVAAELQRVIDNFRERP